MAEQRRLVIRYREGVGNLAYLYPMDAGPFAAPALYFRLANDQPVPRQGPGDPVEVHGPISAPTKVVAQDGTELQIAGRIVTSESIPTFAERGDVVVHPEISGTSPTWRHVRSASFDSIKAWESRLRKAIVAAVVVILAVMSYISIVVVSLASGNTIGGGGGGAAVGGGCALCAAVLAIKSRRALKEARAVRERGRPMHMALWWSTGY